LTGCSQGRYQVAKQDYQAKVQVLGVLPMLIDRAAPLNYPHHEGLYDLLLRTNSNKHEELVARLRAKKGYFDVRSLPGNADMLASSLLTGVQPVDAQGRPNGFSFNSLAVAEIAERNVVDALLVIVFSGAQVEESRRSRNLLETLETRYNDIVVTAAVVARDGEVLWQLAGDESYQLLQLQYADFDEAYYNQSEQVRLKNISLDGIERGLAEGSEKGGVAQLPKRYDELFKRISSGLSPGLFGVLQ
jgi:hypothetical protein